MFAAPYTRTIPGVIASLFEKSSDPIPGLSQAVRNALRLFIPSPQWCYSDTAGTTKAVQDGNVALWKDSLNKGINASQATAGFQPKLRKGAVNLQLNSNPLTGGWSNTFVTLASDGTLTPNGTLAALLTKTGTGTGRLLAPSVNMVSGSTYVVSFYAKAGTVQVVDFRMEAGITATAVDITAPPAGYYSTPIGGGWYRVWRAISPASTAAVRFSLGVNGTTGDSMYFGGLQVELVPAATTPSKYVENQGSTLSNGEGNWWLEFDGTQSRLQLNDAILSATSLQHIVVAGVRAQRKSGNGAVIASTGGNVLVATLIIGNLNEPGIRWRSTTNAAMDRWFGSTLPDYQPTVMAAHRNGNSFDRKFNGVSNAIVNNTMDVAATTTYIGCSAGISEFLLGGVYGIAVADTLASAQEVVAIEKYIGKIVGVTL